MPTPPHARPRQSLGELVANPIAWEAHIGGFVAGLLLLPALDRVPSEQDPQGLA
jgi:membrane associated rhomboid family serine protease